MDELMRLRTALMQLNTSLANMFEAQTSFGLAMGELESALLLLGLFVFVPVAVIFVAVRLVTHRSVDPRRLWPWVTAKIG
jgi:hypothetical protein